MNWITKIRLFFAKTRYAAEPCFGDDLGCKVTFKILDGKWYILNKEYFKKPKNITIVDENPFPIFVINKGDEND